MGNTIGTAPPQHTVRTSAETGQFHLEGVVLVSLETLDSFDPTFADPLVVGSTEASRITESEKCLGEIPR